MLGVHHFSQQTTTWELPSNSFCEVLQWVLLSLPTECRETRPMAYHPCPHNYGMVKEGHHKFNL